MKILLYALHSYFIVDTILLNHKTLERLLYCIVCLLTTLINVQIKNGYQKNSQANFRDYRHDFVSVFPISTLQKEYYATHQYFLSKRSLYLVLWKLTDKDGINTIQQWLVNIQVGMIIESTLSSSGWSIFRLV